MKNTIRLALILCAVTFSAAAGQSIINGTSGNDSLQGTRGRDIIHGLDGDDLIYGGLDQGDEMYGDNGNDVISFSAATHETGYGGTGADRFHFGSMSASRNTGGARDAIADFEPGNDKIWLPWYDPSEYTITFQRARGNDYRMVVVDISGPGFESDMGVDIVVLGGGAPSIADVLN
jgi:hypothetical protein